MMTYRERREQKAERLRDWATKRDTKAEAAAGTAEELMDMIPLGQPILVGHHSEGRRRRHVGRIERNVRQAVDHRQTAERFRERAANIEAAADTAIYSDDADAVTRLEEKIARLEAERERIKAYNKSCRTGKRDVTLLNESQQENLQMLTRVAAFQLGRSGEMPSYASSNLSGNIGRLRKRLATLRESQRLSVNPEPSPYVADGLPF